MRKHFIPFLFLILSGGLVNAQVICGGSNATLQAQNPQNLSGPSYSLNPGGFPSSTGQFVVTPPSTTTYTLYTSGTNTNNTFTTTTAVVQVTVLPQPVAAPTVTNYACNTTTNCWNLNLTFLPALPAPQYTISWLGAPMTPPNIPPNWTNPQTGQCGTLAPSSYTAVITAQGGCTTITTFSIAPPPAPAAFTLSPAPNYFLTCLINTINIAANNPTLGYTFDSPGTGPISSNSVTVTFTNISTWTVTGVHPTSGCVKQFTFSVLSNTVPPTSMLTPTFQNITCTNTPSLITVTAISPTVNFTHYIYSPIPTIWIAKTPTANYQPGPGTYTYCLVNDDSGCSTCKQFTVASSPGFPTFSLASAPAGYTLGCSTKSCLTITYIGAQTTPSPGGAVSYTLLSPGASSVLPPNLSTNQTYPICAPGSYTAIVKDNSNACVTRIPFSVITNTLPPAIDSVIVPRTILDCDHISTVIEGFSHTEGVDYTWSFVQDGGGVGNVTSKPYTVTVRPFVPPTNTVTGTFTLTVQEKNNMCLTRTTVTIYQNMFPPLAFASAGSPSLTCATKSIILTNFSTTKVPSGSIFPTGQVVEAILWEGPSPQLPLENSSTYTATIQGDYTMTVKDRNNGCISTTLVAVGDNQEYPLVTNTYSAFPLECGAETASLQPIFFNPLPPMSYTWVSPPLTIVKPNDNAPGIEVNKIGTYYLTVKNNNSQCITFDSLRVVSDSIIASIAASKVSGYAPLTVEFYNNTLTSTGGNSSITTLWSFGVDSVITTPEASVAPKIVYSQPGTYTVVAYTQRGLCHDTAYAFIKVESPSAMKVPNVFTPNGDGINDLFFLQRAANLSEITAKIFDRWGNIVYEVTSGTGNIEWDGNTQTGRVAPDGTYYFVITSKGTDGVSYEEKGTISLLR